MVQRKFTAEHNVFTLKIENTSSDISINNAVYGKLCGIVKADVLFTEDVTRELRDLLKGIGYSDIRFHRSGNTISATGKRMETSIEARIREKQGLLADHKRKERDDESKDDSAL